MDEDTRHSFQVSKGRREIFHYDFHPLPILQEVEIDNFIGQAENGELKDAFGYDALKLETFLLNAFNRYGFIGELPLSENNFRYLCELIQNVYIQYDRRKIKQVHPALFISTMVFCARYSEEEARKFWQPYAELVWKTHHHQYFQNVCREHFVKSKSYLQEQFGFDFPILTEGGVVRPIYYQAIIPNYLQAHFSEWLINHFEQILEYSVTDLPMVLQKEKSLNYVPPRLKKFVQNNQTSDTAAKLIRQMAKAVHLFQETEQYEAVHSVMDSPIERSLWTHIYKDLIEKELNLEKIRQYTPKFTWVWDVETEEIVLLLSQVRSSKDKKPNLIVWAIQDFQNLRNAQMIMDVHPWRLANGDWELESEIIREWGDTEGRLFVLSEDYDLDKDPDSQPEHIIFEKEIPGFEKDILHFYIPKQALVAREKEKIDSAGEWLILSRSRFIVKTRFGEVVPYNEIALPKNVQNQGYRHARRFDLELPTILELENGETKTFEQPKTAYVLQAQVIGEKQITGLSERVQPVFQKPNVAVQLVAEFPERLLQRIWVSVQRGGKFVSSDTLAKLLNQDRVSVKEDVYQIKLNHLIDRSGEYSVSLLHNLESLLEEDLRFAYLPEIKIAQPDPSLCYSPVKPAEIFIENVPKDQIQTRVEDKVKISPRDEGICLIWKELKLPECRFSLQWEGNNVHFSWRIDRVTAWVEGGGDKKNIFAGQEDEVILEVRGGPKEPFSWLVRDSNQSRKITLDHRGDYEEYLNRTSLRDMLKQSKWIQSSVAIMIRGLRWDVFTYTKIPTIEIVRVKYKKKNLEISIDQSEDLKGDYLIQIIDKEIPLKPRKIKQVQQLVKSTNYEIDLTPGSYQIEILLNNEVIAVSQEMIVAEEVFDAASRQVSDFIVTTGARVTSQHLFESLSADHHTIMRMKKQDHSQLIAPLQQLILVNSFNKWVTKEKLNDGLKRLFPSWAILNYPLRFHTKKHKRVFHVFPQQVAFEGRVGKGYMVAKMDEAPVKVYAAWNTYFIGKKSYLWLMIPQSDAIDRYSELDELELWPGYQCIDCGFIVGSKEGSYVRLSPKITMAHKHEKKRPSSDQFVDTVYKQNIEVDIWQYQKGKLTHCYHPNEVVGENDFSDLLNYQPQPLDGELSLPVDAYSSRDYQIAVSEVAQNYQNPMHGITLKQIIGKRQLFKNIKSYILDKKDAIPAFSAYLRLDKIISANQQRSFLPKNILLLCLILRLKAHKPHYYANLIQHVGSSDAELSELALQAFETCPKLLAWSIFWSEVFFIHSAS